jgi:hypothetical protein
MEHAILVHIATTKKEKLDAEESMEELEGLVNAAGADVVEKIFQYRSEKNPKFMVGEGKVAEIKQRKNELQADLVVFDCNLSPIQQRSLEDEIQGKVIDSPREHGVTKANSRWSLHSSTIFCPVCWERVGLFPVWEGGLEPADPERKSWKKTADAYRIK